VVRLIAKKNLLSFRAF